MGGGGGSGGVGVGERCEFLEHAVDYKRLTAVYRKHACEECGFHVQVCHPRRRRSRRHPGYQVYTTDLDFADDIIALLSDNLSEGCTASALCGGTLCSLSLSLSVGLRINQRKTEYILIGDVKGATAALCTLEGPIQMVEDLKYICYRISQQLTSSGGSGSQPAPYTQKSSGRLWRGPCCTEQSTTVVQSPSHRATGDRPTAVSTKTTFPTQLCTAHACLLRSVGPL